MAVDNYPFAIHDVQSRLLMEGAVGLGLGIVCLSLAGIVSAQIYSHVKEYRQTNDQLAAQNEGNEA